MRRSDQIAEVGLRKMSANLDPDVVARVIANSADDIVLALVRRMQNRHQKKQAQIIPEELANNYFFSNPYGLDFHTWAGMHDITQEEEIPTEPMPEVEGEEPPYDSETEAGYMPNAPDTPDVGTEPTVSPTTPVPLPAGRHRKTAALLQMVAVHELTRRGIIKVSNGDEPGKPVVRQKVEEFLRRNAKPEDSEFHSFADRHGYNTHATEEVAYQAAHAGLGEKNDLIPGGKAQGKPESDYPAHQLDMGQDVEKEHTPDVDKRREIAKDHLEEFPNYYTALKQMEDRLKATKSASLRGRARALSKFGIDAAELLGQDEQRKDDIHQQTIRHNEENHQIDLAKGQLELQQTQETFSMKQQQQQQKNQEQQQQQAMMQQMQQQQQQSQRMQYMSNMSGGGQPQTQGVQQPPQQGMQGPR